MNEYVLFLYIPQVWIKQGEIIYTQCRIKNLALMLSRPSLCIKHKCEVSGEFSMSHRNAAPLCSLSLVPVIPTLPGKHGPDNSSPSTLNIPTSIQMDWTRILLLQKHLFCLSYQLCLYSDLWRKRGIDLKRVNICDLLFQRFFLCQMDCLWTCLLFLYPLHPLYFAGMADTGLLFCINVV